MPFCANASMFLYVENDKNKNQLLFFLYKQTIFFLQKNSYKNFTKSKNQKNELSKICIVLSFVVSFKNLQALKIRLYRHHHRHLHHRRCHHHRQHNFECHHQLVVVSMNHRNVHTADVHSPVIIR